MHHSPLAVQEIQGKAEWRLVKDIQLANKLNPRFGLNWVKLQAWEQTDLDAIIMVVRACLDAWEEPLARPGKSGARCLSSWVIFSNITIICILTASCAASAYRGPSCCMLLGCCCLSVVFSGYGQYPE